MTQQSVFTLYIGGQFDKDGNLIPAEKSYSVLRAAMRDATMKFGGITMLFGWGGYLSPSGDEVVEKSARIEIVTDSNRRAEVNALAAGIRTQLNASEVLVTETVLAGVVWVRSEVFHS